MRLWLRLSITLALLVGAGTGVWCYRHGQSIRCWRAHRAVGAATSFDDARAALAWFEAGPDRDARLRYLVDRWATGDLRFDFYLAEYVRHSDSTEPLRKAFSLGFGWHEDRLPRWAHYWCWRVGEPDDAVDSLLRSLDLRLEAGKPTTLPWREVLNLQAFFQLAGEPRLARRLDPENWSDRYRRWRQNNPGGITPIARPGRPFPDWQASVTPDGVIPD